MFTGGVGALVDLPNFSVLVRGLDDWSYTASPTASRSPSRGCSPPSGAARRRAASRSCGRRRGWTATDADPKGPAARVGVPVDAVPGWLRCTACNELAPVDSRRLRLRERQAAPPARGALLPRQLRRKRGASRSRSPPGSCSPARPGTSTTSRTRHFVHQRRRLPEGQPPAAADGRPRRQPRRQRRDRVRAAAASSATSARRSGERGAAEPAALPGPAPAPGRLRPERLRRATRSCWSSARPTSGSRRRSPRSAVPQTGASELADARSSSTGAHAARRCRARHVPVRSRDTCRRLREFEQVVRRRALGRDRGAPGAADSGDDDADRLPGPAHRRSGRSSPPASCREPTDDFTLRRDPDGVPDELKDFYADVVQVERLREVRALVGFTRLDAPDPEDPDLVTRAPLSQRRRRPGCRPARCAARASSCGCRRTCWPTGSSGSSGIAAHGGAPGGLRPVPAATGTPIGSRAPSTRCTRWPGRALHRPAHAVAPADPHDRAGMRLQLGQPVRADLRRHRGRPARRHPHLHRGAGRRGHPRRAGVAGRAARRSIRLVRRALADALHCSSDPLCAERLPQHPADFLHGAACHVCLFVSETTCERGNRFLDRRFVVPIDDPDLALFPELP